MTSTPPPPPPAGRGTADGFFDSLRRMNTPRSQERWIGGVAGGIATRLGIDPLIVRGVFLVITIFGGFGLLVYGLAWALLPESADGRIHLQEAIRGRFDAALVGAAVFAVIGLSRVGFWWDGWVGIPFMIGMIALAVLAVVVITAIRNSGSSTPPGGSWGGSRGGGTPPPGGGTPPPTAHPGSGGSVPFSTAHPEQSGSVPFSTAHPEQSGSAVFPMGTPPAPTQITPGGSSLQLPSSPWPESETGTAGPWSDEPAASGEPSESAEPEAGAPSSTEHPAGAATAETTTIGAGAPRDTGSAPAGEDATSQYPASAAHHTPDATATVAYPATTAGSSTPTPEPADQAAPWPAHAKWAGHASSAEHATTAEHAAQQTAWSHGAGTTPPPTPPQQPDTAPPPPPPKLPRRARPGPGKVLVRVTFGLALLVIAALVLGAEYYGWPASDWLATPWLIALGGALVVLGLGATLAGVLGRRSGSLGVIGTLLAIVLVPWAISAPVLTQYNFTDSGNYGDRYWAPQTADQAADGYELAAGAIRVDLGDLADEPITTPINIELGAGDVELLVPDGMPVIVTASVQGETSAVNLSDWSAVVNDNPRELGDRTDLGWRLGTSPMVTELTSPEASGETPIPVNIDVGFGAIEVRELR